MELVIWGVGKRGKIAADFVGHHNVIAFVDSNPVLVGKNCYNIPIITLEQYMDIYRDYPLLISPLDNERIIKILNEKNISAYFVLNDCPSEVYLGQLTSVSKIPIPDYAVKSNILIYGNSLYGVLLWEDLLCRGYKASLLMNEKNNRLKEVLNKISIDVYYYKEFVYRAGQIMFKTVYSLPVEMNGIETVDFYRVDKMVDFFYHPELKRFKDIHKGERCFIVGNGSSLSVADLNVLDRHGEICFGMNGILMLFDETKWRPYYYVCWDEKALQAYGNTILYSDIKNILVSDVNRIFIEKLEYLGDHRVQMFHVIDLCNFFDMPEFSEEIEKYVMGGCTVTYVSIQLAVYMGFQKIYLLGIDFDYENGETKSMKHFSEDYHLPGMTISPCRKDKDLLAYQSASKYAKAHEIEIYNATRGGKLEVFERVDFDSLMDVWGGGNTVKFFVHQRIGACA